VRAERDFFAGCLLRFLEVGCGPHPGCEGAAVRCRRNGNMLVDLNFETNQIIRASKP
jgi:hypothetical protein